MTKLTRFLFHLFVNPAKMTVGAGITIEDGNLTVLGTQILSGVHNNLLLTPASGGGMMNGAFIGMMTERHGSHNEFPIGKLQHLRFMCTFHFKLWWMTQRMGSSGRDIPFETQFLIIEGNDGSHFGEEKQGMMDETAIYIVFLPILKRAFVADLQGNDNNELESGDSAVDRFEGTHLAFVVAGSDPFDVINNTVKTVERRLQTFSHRERKKMPDMLNWFGWCTWDAFYTNVIAEGVQQGLESSEKGGIPPKFVIIDDGWQSVDMDPICTVTDADNSANFANRLSHIKKNHKFQKNGRVGHQEKDPSKGLTHIVKEIKEKHDIKYAYVWHAITGYWGGVRLGVTGIEHYESKMTYAVSSPRIKSNKSCDCLSSIATNSLGLVNPEKVFNFYNELHSYLALTRIDGVKVYVQNILETLVQAMVGE